VEHQAEHAQQPLPCAFTRLYQIAQDGFALVARQQSGSSLDERPADARHEALPVRFATHEAPRLTRVTAS
jgi:hypothetical protein